MCCVCAHYVQAAFLAANFGAAVASLVSQRRALLGRVDDVGQPAARLARLLQVHILSCLSTCFFFVSSALFDSIASTHVG